MALMTLREELDLMPGPLLPDGQPSWTLHDPVRNQFFRIDWPSFEILSRWSLDDEEAIADSICTSTTLHINGDDVKQMSDFLLANQLVRPGGTDSSRTLAERLDRQQGTPLTWLLHHYLFFRIPLVHPDSILSRLYPMARAFYTRTFAILTAIAFLLGIGEALRNWDTFRTSLVDTFNWDGLVAYGVAIFFVKFLHELGHAFTAKRYGCRIPAMGIAFLVMWPVAYTDTNESWRLTDNRQRLAIASAGVITELIIAAWATLAWAFLPDGGLRSSAFVLATTSWIATLAVNASPFMRFDGYFILSDALDMPNLHNRSFALARWKMRELLFGLGDPKPEHFASQKEAALVAFAWVVWIYRLVVFLGIAALVYGFFIKAVGIFLFLVEIVWFVSLPIYNELKVWKKRWPDIKQGSHSWRSALVILTLLSLVLVPWPGRIWSSGLLRPQDVWPVFAQGPAQIKQIPYSVGSHVKEGDTLLVLDSPDLQVRRQTAQARVDRLRWSAASAGFSAESRDHLQSAQNELATAEAELVGINNELAQFAPHAPYAGTLRDLDPDLHVGQWITRKEKLALLVGDTGYIVETYLDEEAVKRVQRGDDAIFTADSHAGSTLKLKISNIDADATRILNNGMLTTQAGGHILTRERNGKLIPERAVYRVTLKVESPLDDLGGQSWRGQVVLHAKAESIALRYLRNAFAILLREASF